MEDASPMNEQRRSERSRASRGRRGARGLRVPRNAEEWLREIAAAYRDAREAIPFGDALGEPFGEGELFQLAPLVALKFRGLSLSTRRVQQATDAALASYFANLARHRRALADPHLAFAFCYLASHYGLGLLGAPGADAPMEYAIRHRRQLARLISAAPSAARGVRVRETIARSRGDRLHEPRRPRRR
jgi:hypothetical protein